jgi:hypothetical protein
MIVKKLPASCFAIENKAATQRREGAESAKKSVFRIYGRASHTSEHLHQDVMCLDDTKYLAFFARYNFKLNLFPHESGVSPPGRLLYNARMPTPGSHHADQPYFQA